MKTKDKTRVEKKGQELQKPGRHHVEGISERIDWVLKKYGVTTAIRPHTILRCLLVHPKDKVEPEEQGERHTRFNKTEQDGKWTRKTLAYQESKMLSSMCNPPS